jgi:hypothetical protein
VLVLRKFVYKPEGMAAQVPSDILLQYTKETTTDYKTVLIRHDKVRVKSKRCSKDQVAVSRVHDLR